MIRLITAFLSLSVLTVGAQDKTVRDLKTVGTTSLKEDTTHKSGWKKGALLNLGIAQGATSNWAAGGERSSLALNGYVNLFANLKRDRIRWYNNLDLFYAVINTSSQGKRKNDDRIDLFSKYTYQLKPKLGFGMVGNFRTQFTNGYKYDDNPANNKLTSTFMAPAYLTLAPGFDWTPTSYFSLFFSPISARWTYVGRPSLIGFYGIEPGKKSRLEAGAYLSANFKKEIMKNVVYQSRLDLYSNYLHKPKNIDVFWTNVIGMKVNKLLGVTYNFDLIYDDDVRIFGPSGNAPRTQIKSLLSVGITAKF
jgi:hypothetical protein